MGVAHTVNKLLRPLGIRLAPAVPAYGSLELYPEKVRPSQPVYVNIGAGDFYHPYWHNLDTPNEFYAKGQVGNLHVQHDLTSGLPLPFEHDSLKAVYISHVIEHLSNVHVQHCFAEVYRCLCPGGYFRITCPDMDHEYEAYRRGDFTLWSWPTPWGTRSTTPEQKFLEHVATVLTTEAAEPSGRRLTDEEIRRILTTHPKEEALQYFVDQIPENLRTIRPEYHVNWFNVRKLEIMLRSASFDTVYESRYGQSRCPLMRNTQLFDCTVPGLSLYMECQK